MGLFQHRAIPFNLGIGTTNPGAKLHVEGGALMVTKSTTSLWGDESTGAVTNMTDTDTNATTISQTGALSASHNRIYRATGAVTISQTITVGRQNGMSRGSFPTAHGGLGTELGAILATTDETDSWHSWSSNSRWIVFSSKAQNGLFTRPYFSYF